MRLFGHTAAQKHGLGLCNSPVALTAASGSYYVFDMRGIVCPVGGRHFIITCEGVFHFCYSEGLLVKSNSIKACMMASTLLAGLGAVSAPAFAQEDGVSEDAERIIVTGSRIRRDSNLDSSIPVTQIGLEEIQTSGAFNVAEVIRDLPSAGVPGLTTSTTNFSVFSAGLESVDLRNLGDSRTLTLVDGRRVVPGVPGSSVVDFSMIPPDFIQGIEVVTGGASSVYGSEAIAGVVNILLKDDFEGVEFNARAGSTFESDGEQFRTSVTMGTGLGDSGNFLFNLTYDTREGIRSRDRDYAGTDNFYLGGLGFYLEPLYSTYPETGRFDVSGTGSLGDDLTVIGNSVVPFTRDLGFNRSQYRRILIPQTRFSAAARAEYDLNDWVRLSGSFLYAHVTSDSDIEPFPLDSNNIYNPNGTVPDEGVSIDNPYMPTDIRDALIANGFDYLPFFSRRMTEVSTRLGRYDRTTADYSLQVDGDIPGLSRMDRSFLNNFTYSAYVNYGRSSSVRNGEGQINVQNLRQALDAEVDPVSGNIICSDATARAFGCVPVNIFGLGTISEEAAAYIAAPGQRNAETEQTVWQASATGDLFQLPAGPLSVAVGFEYREIESADIVDALTSAGLNAGNAIDPTVGGFDVTEQFVEVLVPVIADAGFLNSLDLEGAFRRADYSTAGENDSWKYGFTAAFADEQIRVRAVSARATRAPDIGDLFSGNSQSFTSTTDPCAGADVGNPQDNPAACYDLPGVIADNAGGNPFLYSDLEIQSQYVFFSGSELLQPETSDSYSIGVILEPDSIIEGLTVTLDYTSFEITDAITSLSTAQSALLCLEQGGDPANPFCQNVVRDPVTSKILFAFARPINAAVFETDAYDLAITYTNDVPAHWLGFEEGSWGSFNTRLLVTQTESYTFAGDADSTPSEFVGDVGYPERRWNWSVNWMKGPLSVNYRLIHMSEMDLGADPTCNEGLRDLYATIFNSTGVCYTPGLTDWTEHNISASWFFEDMDMEIYGGIDNITEEFVYLPDGLGGSDTGVRTNAGVFDPVGRTFNIGVRKRW